MRKSKMDDGAWWTETWNPVTGCLPEFPCWDNCWARRMAIRLAANPEVKLRDRYVGFRPTFWPERLHEPLRWRKKRRVFVVDMGDLFCKAVPSHWRDEIFSVMAVCQEHTFMLLTKRCDNLERYWYYRRKAFGQVKNLTWPENVWAGCSAWDKYSVNRASNALSHLPEWVTKFLSIEPLFKMSELRQEDLVCVDWVVAGGETGPRARPCTRGIVREIRDECQRAGVPFWFKSWGSKSELKGRELDGRTWEELPE